MPRADTVAQISRGQKSPEFIPADASQRSQPQFTAESFDAFPHLNSGGLVAIVTATFAQDLRQSRLAVAGISAHFKGIQAAMNTKICTDVNCKPSFSV